VRSGRSLSSKLTLLSPLRCHTQASTVVTPTNIATSATRTLSRSD
jgi:hypothetical protein